MKPFTVHSIKIQWKPKASEELQEKTEAYLNKMASIGHTLENVSFHLNPNDTGFVYSYIVHSQ